jgi:hypothetical protein
VYNSFFGYYQIQKSPRRIVFRLLLLILTFVLRLLKYMNSEICSKEDILYSGEWCLLEEFYLLNGNEGIVPFIIFKCSNNF